MKHVHKFTSVTPVATKRRSCRFFAAPTWALGTWDLGQLFLLIPPTIGPPYKGQSEKGPDQSSLGGQDIGAMGRQSGGFAAVAVRSRVGKLACFL